MPTYIRQLTPMRRFLTVYPTIADACAAASEDAARATDYSRPYAIVDDWGTEFTGEALARLVQRMGFPAPPMKFGRGPDWVTVYYARVGPWIDVTYSREAFSLTHAVDMVIGWLVNPAICPIRIVVISHDGKLTYAGPELLDLCQTRLRAAARAKGVLDAE